MMSEKAKTAISTSITRRFSIFGLLSTAFHLVGILPAWASVDPERVAERANKLLQKRGASGLLAVGFKALKVSREIVLGQPIHFSTLIDFSGAQDEGFLAVYLESEGKEEAFRFVGPMRPKGDVENREAWVYNLTGPAPKEPGSKLFVLVSADTYISESIEVI